MLLGGVEVDGDDTVNSSGSEKMGDKGGSDWLTWLGFSILSRISEIRDDEIDFMGACSTESVDEDEDFH